jgi:hypothetical protein
VLIRGARFDNPTPMVVDEKNVYVSSGGILLAVPKDGSAPPKGVFDKTEIVNSLAADATHLYVGVYPIDVGSRSGAIFRIDERSLTAKEILRTESISALGVDDEFVWFGLLRGGAYRVAKDGGKVKTVFADRGQVNAIAVDEENVYFAVTQYGRKQRAEIDVVRRKGGAFSVFTSDVYDAMGVLALPDAIVVNDSGTLKRFPRAGGPPVKLSGHGSVVAIARRGADVLYGDIPLADARPAGVFVAGTPPSILDEGPGAVGIAVDGSSVYWADATQRTVSALELGPPR